LLKNKIKPCNVAKINNLTQAGTETEAGNTLNRPTVKLCCVLVRCGREVCMTLVENRAVDLFYASD